MAGWSLNPGTGSSEKIRGHRDRGAMRIRRDFRVALVTAPIFGSGSVSRQRSLFSVSTPDPPQPPFPVGAQRAAAYCAQPPLLLLFSRVRHALPLPLQATTGPLPLFLRFEVPGNQRLKHRVEIMRTVFVCYHRYLFTHGEKASLH